MSLEELKEMIKDYIQKWNKKRFSKIELNNK